MPASAKKAQPETVALFVSDLHLQPALPRTTDAFLAFLREQAMHTRQLYLLGDIFEAWAGDDDITDVYNAQIVQALRQVSDNGVALFWIAGNRDFLVGGAFAAASGIRLLSDPFVADIAGKRMVLTHGDAHCTDDDAYMAFRAQVRNPAWQQQFLAMPLAQRKQIIEDMRTGSREAQRDKPMSIMDVNATAIASLFEATQAELMIHGHTHRPALHREGTKKRYVLPDWDCDATPARGGWIGIDAGGSVTRYNVDGSVIRTAS